MAKQAGVPQKALAVQTVRRQLGLTQASLARLIGVHPMTVSRWERGELVLGRWHQCLLDALLWSQPRANLEQRLTEPHTDPVMILAHLLSDSIQTTDQTRQSTAPSVTLIPSVASPSRQPLRTQPLSAPPTRASLPLPASTPPILLPPAPDKSVSRFSLLEVDDDPDDAT